MPVCLLSNHRQQRGSSVISMPQSETEGLEQAGAIIHRVEREQDGGLDLAQILHRLGKADITSVLVEGGAAVHGSFLKKKLVDQVYLFTAPYFIGEQGTSLFSGYSIGEEETPLSLQEQTTETVGRDILIQGLLY